MAYVNVPKDLSNIKAKLMFNMTGRQLVLFAIGLGIGAPVFWWLSTIDNTLAMLALMIIVSPLMFFAIYEKDGMTGEQFLKQIYKVRFKRNPIRVFKTQNFYNLIQEAVTQEEKEKRRGVSNGQFY